MISTSVEGEICTMIAVVAVGRYNSVTAVGTWQIPATVGTVLQAFFALLIPGRYLIKDGCWGAMLAAEQSRAEQAERGRQPTSTAAASSKWWVPPSDI